MSRRKYKQWRKLGKKSECEKKRGREKQRAGLDGAKAKARRSLL